VNSRGDRPRIVKKFNFRLFLRLWQFIALMRLYAVKINSVVRVQKRRSLIKKKLCKYIHNLVTIKTIIISCVIAEQLLKYLCAYHMKEKIPENFILFRCSPMTPQ
jgi:uncharacterized BrkB/YihY/UPF0761 family membrane protein